MTDIFFLPGAGASASFWRPVADRLPGEPASYFFSWPGLGNEPASDQVNGFDDLVAMVLETIREPSDVVAQSMGGLVAVRVALAAPEKIRRIVLTATSAGAPVASLGGVDWRPDYRDSFPNAAEWITEVQEDLSSRLKEISAPTLLLWGDKDPISPVAVGEHLLGLLPKARLHVIKGGDHDLAQTHAEEVAAVISEHLG
jgi:pimeloyl-ACP methyl ester carboxylesterase